VPKFFSLAERSKTGRWGVGMIKITWSLGILPEFQAGVSLERSLKSKPYLSMNPLKT
jgi:hypothetical protein